MIEAEYIHELGVHESKSIVINPQINGVRNTTALFQAAGLPVLGEIQDYDSIGRSRYDAMNLSYRKRMSKNFTINTSYVLSRGLAYNGGLAAFGNGPTDELNWFAPHDLGPTPADETHRIAFSGVFNLPFKITFSPILQWATGRPYSTLEGVNDTYGFGGGQGSTHTIVLTSGGPPSVDIITSAMDSPLSTDPPPSPIAVQTNGSGHFGSKRRRLAADSRDQRGPVRRPNGAGSPEAHRSRVPVGVPHSGAVFAAATSPTLVARQDFGSAEHAGIINPRRMAFCNLFVINMLQTIA